MLPEEIHEKIVVVAAPIVAEAGLELVELIIAHSNHGYTIEILIDRPAGGISLEECALVNKRVSEELELAQSITVDFDLVVASPGLDRLLKNEKDFKRVMNVRVRFVLTEKVEGKGEYSGKVKEVRSEDVLVATKKLEIRIPYSKILKAVQII